jgi:hypothetical protein
LVEWWLAGKPKYLEETCPSAALSTTNPTCWPYANQGRRGGKPATNRLSYGTAPRCLSYFVSFYVMVTSDTSHVELTWFIDYYHLTETWIQISEPAMLCNILNRNDIKERYILYLILKLCFC